MRSTHRLMLICVAGILALTASLAAQEPAPPVQPPQPQSAARAPRGPATPLEVQVSISRYLGEKRVNSMPFVVAVNAAPPGQTGQPAQLNMGANVPIPSPVFAPVPAADSKPGDAKPPSPIRSYNYQNIGTNIDCRASATDDGRFELSISVDENSVYTKEGAGGTGGLDDVPTFRTFKSRNVLLLRDGQTRQYTAATDRVSGETVRIEVTLKVVK